MKILALITARGGSKRLPGKNIKILGDKPLIAWTIDTAIKSGSFTDVIVSTDDEKIAEIAEKHGAKVPWIRPAELATDEANSVDVSIHALNWYQKNIGTIEGLMLLQPTSPFRQIDTIKHAIKIYKENNGVNSVVSFNKLEINSDWLYEKRDKGLKKLKRNTKKEDTRIDIIHPNGIIYLINPTELKSKKKFINKNTIAIITTNNKESIDIDTKTDWKLAEMHVEMKKNENN